MGATVSLGFLEGFVGDSVKKIDGTALRFFLPFSSYGTVTVSTDESGAPYKGVPLGFSVVSATSVQFAADGSFVLPVGNSIRSAPFTIPLDCAIDSVYVSVNLGAAADYSGGKNALPGVIIYKAPSGNNTFSPISETETLVGGFSGNETTVGKLNDESKTNIGAILNAGDRLIVMAVMRATGSSSGINLQGVFSVGVSFIAAGTSDAIPPAVPVTANTASLQNTNAETIDVTDAEPVSVAFPNSSLLANDFMLSSENTSVTVMRTGTYRISYRVSGVIPEGARFNVLLGEEEAESLRRIALANGEVTCSSVLQLKAPVDIFLKVSGVNGSVVLSEGAGAELIITQIA